MAYFGQQFSPEEQVPISRTYACTGCNGRKTFSTDVPQSAHKTSFRETTMKRFFGLLLVFLMCVPLLGGGPQAPSQSSARTVAAVAASSQQTDRGNPDVKVWVNTASGVYHCPGTRWYGATKRGEYMTEAEAQKKGYRPAYGKVCR